MLRERLDNREQRFLQRMKTAIYEHPSSPYRPLLDEARCSYQDLHEHVTKDGIEATLEILYRAGVALTYEQFKGNQPVQCGGKTHRFDPGDFDSPLAVEYFLGSTGGTRSGGTPARTTFAWHAERAIYDLLLMDVYDALNAALVVWLPT